MSSDLNFTVEDLTDSKSAAQKMTDSFYPNGKAVYTNTTQSTEDNPSRSLTSADPIRVLQGDGIYRNPAFAVNGYIQNVKSSMHSIIGVASDIDDSVKIPDPADPTKTLSGAAARQEIAKQSLLTTGYAPGGFESTVKAMVGSSSMTDSGTSATDTYGLVGEKGIKHSAKGYTTYSDPGTEVLNGGSRAIALESELSDQEKKVYDSKLKELHSKANFAGSTLSTFSINFDRNKYTTTEGGKKITNSQDLKSLGFAVTSWGGYKSDGTSLGSQTIEQIGTGIQQCRVSAALIELLLRITDKIYIYGEQGTGRGIVGSNFSALTKEDNSVSDHAFGRGFDIFNIGVTKAQAIDLKKINKKEYRQALELMLTHIQNLPPSLQPDLIVISSDLITDLGINEKGLEDANSQIRKQFPNIAPHVNFGADGSHRNHIHISFGPVRAGSFVTPEIAAEINGTQFSGTSATSTEMIELFKKVHRQSDKPAAFTLDQTYNLLVNHANFGQEVAALFAAIVVRESRGNVWSSNDEGAFGLFQFMTRGKLNGSSQGEDTVARILIPSEESIPFWKFAYKNWQAEGLGSMSKKERNTFLRDKQKNDPTKNAGRGYFDERAFIPINQAQMLRAKLGMDNKDNKDMKINWIGSSASRSIIHPWGEGFLYFGALSGVKYSDVKKVYVSNSGKTEADFVSWITSKMNKDARSLNPDPVTGKTILESWLEGKEYPVLYKRDGLWGKNDERPNGWPDIYVDNKYPKDPTPN